MIEWKDVFYVGTFIAAAIIAWITLRVQFDRHEKEDNDRFMGIVESRKENLEAIEKDRDVIRGQLKEIYVRLQSMEIKQSAYDSDVKHNYEFLNDIKDRLIVIENLVRTSRRGD